MRLRLLQFALLAVVALLLAYSCARPGSRSPVDSLQRSEPPTAMELPAPAALDELLRGVSAGVFQRNGADFESALPHLNVAAEDIAGLYEPLGGNFDDLAFAIYTFNSGSNSGPALLSYDWLDPLPAPENNYLALANFARDSWDWHATDGSGSHSIDSLSEYISSSGLVYLLVLLRGEDPASLAGLILDTQSTYDEIEDNDTWDNPQVLPAAPIIHFKGSLGNGPDYPGHDGDIEDWYSIAIPEGMFLHVALEERLDTIKSPANLESATAEASSLHHRLTGIGARRAPPMGSMVARQGVQCSSTSMLTSGRTGRITEIMDCPSTSRKKVPYRSTVSWT